MIFVIIHVLWCRQTIDSVYNKKHEENEETFVFLSSKRRVEVGQEGFFPPRERENEKQIKHNIESPRRNT